MRYCCEPIENINGYKEAVASPIKYDCHHVNEINHTVQELKDMGMYYNRPASELVFMTHSDHMRMHRDRRLPSCVQGPAHPHFGKFREASKSWKGDNVSVQARYVRAKKQFRLGQITEEEFQPVRNEWAEYQRVNIKPKLKSKAQRKQTNDNHD